MQAPNSYKKDVNLLQMHCALLLQVLDKKQSILVEKAATLMTYQYIASAGLNSKFLLKSNLTCIKYKVVTILMCIPHSNLIMYCCSSNFPNLF